MAETVVQYMNMDLSNNQKINQPISPHAFKDILSLLHHTRDSKSIKQYVVSFMCRPGGKNSTRMYYKSK